MHGKLLLEAFGKVQETTGEEVVTKQAKKLSDIIEELSGEPFGERRLRDLRRHALRGRKVRLKEFVADALCRYVEYNSLEDYYLKNQIQIGSPDHRRKRLVSLQSLGATLLFMTVIAAGWYWANKEEPNRVMMWDGNKYKEVSLDSNIHTLGALQPYNEEKLNQLKKIRPDCNTLFFDAQGEALLWYGKNVKGELEYFTALAKHPETGKSLKEITPYMIRKYICPSFKE